MPIDRSIEKLIIKSQIKRARGEIAECLLEQIANPYVDQGDLRYWQGYHDAVNKMQELLDLGD